MNTPNLDKLLADTAQQKRSLYFSRFPWEANRIQGRDDWGITTAGPERLIIAAWIPEEVARYIVDLANANPPLDPKRIRIPVNGGNDPLSETLEAESAP